MNTNIKFNLIFIVGIVAVCFSACQKDHNNPQADEINLLIKSNPLEQVSFLPAISDYLYCARDSFSMELVCSCDCKDIQWTPDILSSCIGSLGNFGILEQLSVYDCSQHYRTTKVGCDFEDVNIFLDSINQYLQILPMITNDEIDFFNELVERTYDEIDFSKTDLVNLYNLVPDSNKTFYSESIVEIISAFLDFVSNDPDFFGENPNEISALFHKVIATIGSAVLSPVIALSMDIVENQGTGNYQFTTMKQVKQSFIAGAIGGLMFSR